MRIDIKIVLLVIFSFIFGIFIFGGVSPIVYFETKMLLDIFNSGNSLLHQIGVLLWVLSHLLVISLLFLKPFRLYSFFLILFPAAFLFFSFTNMFIIVIMTPVLLITSIPFIIVWIILMVKQNKLSSNK